MSDPVREIGFIGLGHMGLPMTRRLIAAGFGVRAFDVAEAARAAAAGVGATAVDSAAEAADGADAVILMLPNSEIVASVLHDPDVATALGRGATVIDMSSSEPLRTAALAQELAARGVRLVDAPVSGGVRGAEAGTLTIMVGGDDADAERVEPVLAAMGSPRHVGKVGAGHAVKALNNLLSATHLWVTSEVMTAGERFGLDPDTMLSVFNGSSGRSGSTENKFPNFIRPGGYDSGFGLRLMLKDMRIAAQLAEQSGAPSRLGEQAVRLWDEAAQGLDAAADHTEVARWVDGLARSRAAASAAQEASG